MYIIYFRLFIAHYKLRKFYDDKVYSVIGSGWSWKMTLSCWRNRLRSWKWPAAH